MKKSKAKDIDLLYVPEEHKKKNKDVAGMSKPAIKGKKHKKQKSEVFNFDDEIVIGLQKKEKKEKNKKKEKKKKNVVSRENKKNSKRNNKITDKEQKNKIKILEYIFLFLLILGSTVYFLMSPIFNIKKITVENNNLISTNEIISLSGISTEENTFRIKIGQAEKNIKENAYIESVEIKRKLPNEILITVQERKATYMLELINGFVYINNQGYILETNENKINSPIITGYETPIEELKPGNRLCNNDLYKLESVLKIMETANSYDIGEKITKIDISDKNNYTLILEGEKKIVYLGDASNINTRIMYLTKILEMEQGIESEVFINGDINEDDVYTREKV